MKMMALSFFLNLIFKSKNIFLMLLALEFILLMSLLFILPNMFYKNSLLITPSLIIFIIIVAESSIALSTIILMKNTFSTTNMKSNFMIKC